MMINDLVKKACGVCGFQLSARGYEVNLERAFTCKSLSAVLDGSHDEACYFQGGAVSSEVLAAISGILSKQYIYNDIERERTRCTLELLLDYAESVGEGEPSIEWFRSRLKLHNPNRLSAVILNLPSVASAKRRLTSIQHLKTIDNYLDRIRVQSNDYFADLACEYVEYQYEVLNFSYGHGLYGDDNPVKLITIAKYVQRIGYYLEWLYKEGHTTLQHTGKASFDMYVAESNLRSFYEVSAFIDFVRKRHPFVQALNYSQRNKKKLLTSFKVLTIAQAQEAFATICAFAEPTGRALALLALIYSQTLNDSLRLKSDDLKRDEESGLWRIEREDGEGFLLMEQLSVALDECLSIAREDSGLLDTHSIYVFPGRFHGHLHKFSADKRVLAASGVRSALLRRTGIVNIYRGGQRTAGSVVLRDILNVSSPTIRRAIQMTGESVNSPLPEDEAEALKQAFLADDD